MPPIVLNENLISRYKSLVASLYVEPPKEVEVGSFESEKELDFTVDSTTAIRTTAKTNIPTKHKRKSEKTSSEKQDPAKRQSKDIRGFFSPSKVISTTRNAEAEKLVIDLTD